VRSEFNADRLINGRTDKERMTDRQRQTDRQTDMMKLVVAFRNFAKVPKKERRKNKSLLINSISYFLARSLYLSNVTDCSLDF
jgi:hypothetical protein